MKNTLCISTVIILLAFSAQAAEDVSTLQSIQQSCSQLINHPGNTSVLQGLPQLSKGTEDQALKAALVSTYAMGMFFIGNDQAANKAIRLLQKAYPASKHLSLFTGSQYNAACPKCNGSGNIQVSCTRCSGKGRCAGCNGSGKIQRMGGKSDRCSLCGSTGRCPLCDGTGKQANKCNLCYGSGTTVSKELILNSYLSIAEETRVLAYGKEQTAKGLVEFEGRWITAVEKQAEISRRDIEAKTHLADAERALAEERRIEAEAQAQLLLAQQDRNLIPTTRQDRTGDITPSVSELSFSEIKRNMSSMTDVQFEVYAKSLKGNVVEWSGWVEEVKKKFLGGYECLVDMESPYEMISIQDVQFDITENFALKLNKDSRIKFRGTINRIMNIVTSCQISLDNVTVVEIE